VGSKLPLKANIMRPGGGSFRQVGGDAGVTVGGARVGVGGMGVGVAVGMTVGASAVSVAATALASATSVATRSGVGVVTAGAPHPTKSNITNVTPIICRSNFWQLIFHSFLRDD